MSQRVELRQQVTQRLSTIPAEQVTRELELLFPDQQTEVTAYQILTGFERNQSRKLLLAVTTIPIASNDPQAEAVENARLHIVKLGTYEAVAPDDTGWRECTRGRHVSSRMFMQVRLKELSWTTDGKPARAGVVYEDAAPLYGPLETDEDVKTLADAALESVRNNDIDVASIERVLRQAYSELRRWFYAGASPERERALEFFREKLRLDPKRPGEPAHPVFETWESDDLGPLRTDALWLLRGPLPPKLESPPTYDDPIDYLNWVFQHHPKAVPETLVGRSHGDFHGRNVLVGVSRGEVEYPVIVDYGDMGVSNALIWDFVKQETELKVRLLESLADDEPTRVELLKSTPERHLQKLVDRWKKIPQWTARDRRARDLLLAFQFENRLASECAGLDSNNTTSPFVFSEGKQTPLEKALAVLVRIRLEAAIQLGHSRVKPQAWREEYEFALAAYGVSTAKFAELSYSPRLLGFALISAGCAVCRLESYRAKIAELTKSSATAARTFEDTVPSGPYPSHVVPLHHAYLRWGKHKYRTVALELLERAHLDFPHAVSIQREYALLLTGSGKADAARRVLEGLTCRSDRVREALTNECRIFGDFETLSRIGSVYKILGDDAGESSSGIDPAGPAYQHYRAALWYYLAAFDFSHDHFPGGNAAVLALLTGDPEKARSIAEEVVAICRKVLPSDLSPDNAHWLFCTEATMALILDDLENAVRFQKKALDALEEISVGYIQSSYNQLCRLWHVLDHGKVERVIDEIKQHPIWTQLRAGPCGNCGVTRLNQALLDRIESDTWRHYRKTKPIWARQTEYSRIVDTREGTLQASAGDYLCRGVVGELWPQKSEKLNSTYVATQNVDAEGWREYQPRADSAGVYAVSVDKPFTVTATYGTLEGQPGDYVVKHAADGPTAYPEDVWIVGRTIFESTYEAVVESPSEVPARSR
jgi:hypothetical protein